MRGPATPAPCAGRSRSRVMIGVSVATAALRERPRMEEQAEIAGSAPENWVAPCW